MNFPPQKPSFKRSFCGGSALGGCKKGLEKLNSKGAFYQSIGLLPGGAMAMMKEAAKKPNSGENILEKGSPWGVSRKA